MLCCDWIEEDCGLRGRFAYQLDAYIRRAGFPVRRVAIWSGIPHQTLNNWMHGVRPRWHPALPDDLRRLGMILGLTDRESGQLLQASGCTPLQTGWPFKLEVKMEEKQNVPHGWFAAGSHPHLYAFDLDQDVLYQGKMSATIKAGEHPEGFATLMQTFSAADYKGRRLRFSAAVCAEGVTCWGALWMRVDAKDGETVAFDNMLHRPIKGTSGWQKYEVVLDVPEQGEAISLGVFLDGPGQLWMADVAVEAVGLEVPLTVHIYPSHPVNLSFTEEF